MALARASTATLPQSTRCEVPKAKKKVVLNKSVLGEVTRDIAVTSLPSRIGRVPDNVGSAGEGTLSADQWRTLCMIHLVITLTRLWGGLPDEDRRRQLLDNYLDMVAAVRYANVRRTSRGRIATYRYHIFRYVRGLRTLFPEQDLVPNHHLALHLGEVLEGFGPTHAYWAFPFERLIRIIRQAKVNYRRGNFSSERWFMRSKVNVCPRRRD